MSILSNQLLFDQARRVIPGGVNSPVRAFGAVGGTPRFIVRGQGAHVWDAEGSRYIDYINSWGPTIVGHAHPEVIAAVLAAVSAGLGFGTPSEVEVRLAEEVCALMPAIEQVRLVSSGTEAVMSALRLARGFTHRQRVVKFDGCYHGHADSMLIRAGSGPLTFGHPTSDGVQQVALGNTLVLDYNDIGGVEATFAAAGHEIAAVIVEPIAANMNLVRATPDFLLRLRQLCDQYGIVLIFDEVLSGFRVALGGAQSLYGIKPDLTCLGKVIGGGLPVAAFGGRRDIMQGLAPVGSTYQAGTLSGNPVAVTAGLATLKLIQAPGFFDRLSEQAARLAMGLQEAGANAGIPFCADQVGGIVGLYFSERVPRCLRDVQQIPPAVFAQFFHGMLEMGAHFAPSMYEVVFVSSAHDDSVIDETVSMAKKVFKDMPQIRFT